MNETRMSDLLHRATDRIEPDVEALVAEGVRRGRVRRRNRRVAAAGGALAAVAVVAVGWQQVGDDRAAIDPADRPSAAASPSTPTPSETSSRDARLAVTADQIPGTFVDLEGGEVESLPQKSGEPAGAPVVDFRWDGVLVTVGITPDDYVTGRSVPDPLRRCRTQGNDPCEQRADGTVVSAFESTGPAVDGGLTTRFVTRYRPDGWDVTVTVSNGAGKGGPVVADQPPLTIEEIEQVASSDVWLD